MKALTAEYKPGKRYANVSEMEQDLSTFKRPALTAERLEALLASQTARLKEIERQKEEKEKAK